VLTPLTLSDGTAVPVVRGWVARAGDPAAASVPSGTVTVTGRLQPSESTDTAPRSSAAPTPGQVTAISSAELINVWTGTRLVNGYVSATAPVTGGTAAGPAPRLVATPPPTVPGGLTWRNLAYAAQWWIFGVFAVFMWYHFVRDAVRRRRGPDDPGPGGRGPGGEEAGGGPEPAGPTALTAGYREATEPRPR
jgi:cytochrome oxidase assembly protein ShyY1